MLLIFSALIGSAAMPATASQNHECRSVPVSISGRMVQQQMCRGADGQWYKQSATATQQGPLPPGFRGKVVYRGTYNGATQTARRAPRIDLRRLTVGSILNQVGAAAPKSEEYSGSATYTLEFDGNLVTGSYQGSGPGGTSSGQLSGTRTGDTCELFDPKAEATVSAVCDGSAFRGTGSGKASKQSSWTSQFDASAVELVDYVERDRLAAIASAKAEADAKVARAAAVAERAKMKRLLPKGAAARFEPMIESTVVADSRSWAINRYAPGSIELVAAKLDQPSGAMFTKAYFRYADGREGWVGVAFKGGAPACLIFWDDPSGCRAIGDGMGGKLMKGAVTAMMTPPSWMSSGGSGYGSDAGYQQYEAGCRAEGKTPGNC